MTKQQAIEAMKTGEKLTHRYFSEGEWVSMKGNFTMIFEDGCKIDSDTFWNDRKGEGFNNDWELFEQ